MDNVDDRQKTIKWDELSQKSKYWLISWFVGPPVVSVILWSMKIPNLFTYLILLNIAVALFCAVHTIRKKARQPDR